MGKPAIALLMTLLTLSELPTCALVLRIDSLPYTLPSSSPGPNVGQNVNGGGSLKFAGPYPPLPPCEIAAAARCLRALRTSASVLRDSANPLRLPNPGRERPRPYEDEVEDGDARRCRTKKRPQMPPMMYSVRRVDDFDEGEVSKSWEEEGRDECAD